MIVEREFLELPPSDDPAAQAAAQAAAVAALAQAVAQAQEERRRAELEARKREAAESEWLQLCHPEKPGSLACLSPGPPLSLPNAFGFFFCF